MVSFALKNYQIDVVEELAKFCDECRSAVLAGAKYPIHDAFRTVTGREYLDTPQFEGIPYVYLRVPTGGGKTLLGAHAVGTVAKRLGHHDKPICLWVTPNTTIRDQTIRALQNREHPYHLALKDSLGQRPDVTTLEEALTANRSKTDAGVLVVVTTIQSYRIDKEENRKIYQDNGYLMDHFENLPEVFRAGLNVDEQGRTPYSFANVLNLLRPVVIMDEAHNARTKTSFDSLARMKPMAVIELTATPKQKHDPNRDEYASNVLHSVSAVRLKKEGMIKLPVDLESRLEWQDVLTATVKRREKLAESAVQFRGKGGRYIRPIALIQAQAKSKTKTTITVDKVKDALLNLKVAPESIRIATGELDDLKDENLNLESSPVNYVITVEKLREGWDCPFAYVLGSIGNVATETAVEQILGRILRMPHATPTGVPELDRAYAIVLSKAVQETAIQLTDSLVNSCGFDRESAADVFRIQKVQDRDLSLPFSSIVVSELPEVSVLPKDVRGKIIVDAEQNRIDVIKPLSRSEAIALQAALPKQADKEAVQDHWEAERDFGTVKKKLHEYAEPFRLPQLALKTGDLFARFEPTEIDEFEWNLDACDPKFSETEFSGELRIGRHTTIDTTDAGAIKIGRIEELVTRDYSLFHGHDFQDEKQFVRWLGQELHAGGKFTGLTAAESHAWLARVVTSLVNDRKLNLNLLERKRFELSDKLYDRVREHGRQQIRNLSKSIFQGRTEYMIETTLELPFIIEEYHYSPIQKYKGVLELGKHAFDAIAEMGQQESECAKIINDHPNVYRWLRNLSYESAGGFHLPLSPGKFFPDFIAETKNGKTVIIEYKNSKLDETKDEQHKKFVGDIWEARSNGQCRFLWIVDKDWDLLDKRLSEIV